MESIPPEEAIAPPFAVLRGPVHSRIAEPSDSAPLDGREECLSSEMESGQGRSTDSALSLHYFKSDFASQARSFDIARLKQTIT